MMGQDNKADAADRRYRRRGTRLVRAGLAAALAAALAQALTAGVAGAAAPAIATTGPARQISFSTATLTGSVDPQGTTTFYYFQYGLTRAYGAQSTIAEAGAGHSFVPVALGVGALAPLTQYHYRLVAVNGGGASFGADRTLLTAKVPLSLQIVAAPNPVAYGGATTVEGTLSGTGNANRPIVLQTDPFGSPIFQSVGNVVLTSASGGFVFPIVGLTASTGFRVATLTTPPVFSAFTVVTVTVRVSSHIARTGRAHRARIFGTVTPAEDGQHVAILRIVHGRGVVVGTTVLRHRDLLTSTFSRVVGVHPGVYRVLVQVVARGQASAYGPPMFIG
jgi:hypothetical protein